jgi:hypothetical protein
VHGNRLPQRHRRERLRLAGTFVFIETDKNSKNARRMVPREEAAWHAIVKNRKIWWGREEDKVEILAARMMEEEVAELRGECLGDGCLGHQVGPPLGLVYCVLQWVIENKLEDFQLLQQAMQGGAERTKEMLRAKLRMFYDQHNPKKVQAPDVEKSLAGDVGYYASNDHELEILSYRLKEQHGVDLTSVLVTSTDGSAAELLVLYRRLLHAGAAGAGGQMAQGYSAGLVNWASGSPKKRTQGLRAQQENGKQAKREQE